METIKNAILAGNQREMTLMGVTFNVPVLPKNLYSEKKRVEFAEKEAEKMLKILNS